MNFYLKILILVVLLSFLSVKIVNNEKQVILSISRGLFPCAFLCCMAGARSLNVGKDNYSYSRIFLEMTYEKVHLFNLDFCWVYNLWDFVIRKFTDNVYVFNLCCAIVIYLSLYLFIHRYSTDERVSIFLFITLGIFFNSMNQTRQALSTAILLFGFKYAVDRKLIKAMFFCFVATFIHNVAIVMIPIYAFICLVPKVSSSVVMIFSGSSLAVALLYNRLMWAFVHVFPKYKHYLKYSKLFVERRSIYRYADFFMSLMLQVLFVCGIYLTRKKALENKIANRDEEDTDNFGNILACMNSVNLCMTYLILNGDIFNRLKSLFFYWVLLVIPYLIRKYFNDNVALKILVCMISIVYMWRLGVHDGDGVIPYQFFFKWEEILK